MIDRDSMFKIYRERKNFRKVEGICGEGANHLCGDAFKLYLKIKNEIIEDAGIEGNGCMLSTVSASLLVDFLKGKRIDEVLKLNENDMYAIVGIDLSQNPVRAKCLLLPLHILKNMNLRE